MKKIFLFLLACLPIISFASEPTYFNSKVVDSFVNQNNHILSVQKLEELYQNKDSLQSYIMTHPDKAIIVKSYFSFRARLSERDYKVMQLVVKDEEDLEKTFTWQNIYINLEKNLMVNSEKSCQKDYASNIFTDPSQFKMNDNSLSIKHDPTEVGDVSSFSKLLNKNVNNDINLIYIPSTYSLELLLTNQDRDLNDQNVENLLANSTVMALSNLGDKKQGYRTYRVKGIYYSFEDVQDLKVATLKDLATYLYYSNNQKEIMPSLEVLYKRNQALCLY